MSKIKFFTKLILFTASLNLASQAFAKEKEEQDFNKEMQQQIQDFEKWSADFDKRMTEFRAAILQHQKGFFDDSFFIGEFDDFNNLGKNHASNRDSALQEAGFVENKKSKRVVKSSQFASVTQKEDEKTLSYNLEFAGFNKDEINVDVKNNYLTFSSVKNSLAQDKKSNKQTNFSSSFYYSFALPKNVDATKYEVLKEEKRVVVKFTKIIPQNKSV